jgi:hypothetical protein
MNFFEAGGPRGLFDQDHAAVRERESYGSNGVSRFYIAWNDSSSIRNL